MFAVKTSKGDFKLGFTHVNEAGSISRYTIATLYDMDKKVICKEIAACSEKDNFNKSVGRKVSLARVIRNMFNRTDRELIWKEYFKIHK
jgi:SET domain-containing protein